MLLSMEITVRHTQESIDPAASYSDAEFETVIASLEKEYEKALKAEYPHAEIEFLREQDTYSNTVSGIADGAEYEAACNRVQDILGTVFETGNFWT